MKIFFVTFSKTRNVTRNLLIYLEFIGKKGPVSAVTLFSRLYI